MLKIPGRTAEEKALDFKIILVLSLWLAYHPDKGTWKNNKRWLVMRYYRMKWQTLCE